MNEHLTKLDDDLIDVLNNARIEFSILKSFYEKILWVIPKCDTLEENEKTLFVHSCLQFIECVAIFFGTLQPLTSNQIEVLQNFMDIILDISKTEDVKDWYIPLIAISLLQMIIRPDIPKWFNIELIKIFNAAIKDIDEHLRYRLVKENCYHFCKLIDELSVYGDFEYQMLLLETIFSVFTDELVQRFAHDLFPESEILKKSFCKIKRDNLFYEIRKFLNVLNSRVKCVLSFQVEFGIVDDDQIRPPKNFCGKSELWVDFNIGSKTVTIACSKHLFLSEEFYQYQNEIDIMKIAFDDVKMVKMSKLPKDKLDESFAALVLFKLNEQCQIVSSGNTVKDNLKLVIFNMDDVAVLENDVLPLLFGNKFEKFALSSVGHTSEDYDTSKHIRSGYDIDDHQLEKVKKTVFYLKPGGAIEASSVSDALSLKSKLRDFNDNNYSLENLQIKVSHRPCIKSIDQLVNNHQQEDRPDNNTVANKDASPKDSEVLERNLFAISTSAVKTAAIHHNELECKDATVEHNYYSNDFKSISTDKKIDSSAFVSISTFKSADYMQCEESNSINDSTINKLGKAANEIRPLPTIAVAESKKIIKISKRLRNKVKKQFTLKKKKIRFPSLSQTRSNNTNAFKTNKFKNVIGIKRENISSTNMLFNRRLRDSDSERVLNNSFQSEGFRNILFKKLNSNDNCDTLSQRNSKIVDNASKEKITLESGALMLQDRKITAQVCNKQSKPKCLQSVTKNCNSFHFLKTQKTKNNMIQCDKLNFNFDKISLGKKNDCLELNEGDLDTSSFEHVEEVGVTNEHTLLRKTDSEDLELGINFDFLNQSYVNKNKLDDVEKNISQNLSKKIEVQSQSLNSSNEILFSDFLDCTKTYSNYSVTGAPLSPVQNLNLKAHTIFDNSEICNTNLRLHTSSRQLEIIQNGNCLNEKDKQISNVSISIFDENVQSGAVNDLKDTVTGSKAQLPEIPHVKNGCLRNNKLKEYDEIELAGVSNIQSESQNVNTTQLIETSKRTSGKDLQDKNNFFSCRGVSVVIDFATQEAVNQLIQTRNTKNVCTVKQTLNTSNQKNASITESLNTSNICKEVKKDTNKTVVRKNIVKCKNIFSDKNLLSKIEDKKNVKRKGRLQEEDEIKKKKINFNNRSLSINSSTQSARKFKLYNPNAAMVINNFTVPEKPQPQVESNNTNKLLECPQKIQHSTIAVDEESLIAVSTINELNKYTLCAHGINYLDNVEEATNSALPGTIITDTEDDVLYKQPLSTEMTTINNIKQKQNSSNNNNTNEIISRKVNVVEDIDIRPRVDDKRISNEIKMTDEPIYNKEKFNKRYFDNKQKFRTKNVSKTGLNHSKDSKCISLLESLCAQMHMSDNDISKRNDALYTSKILDEKLFKKKTRYSKLKVNNLSNNDSTLKQSKVGDHIDVNKTLKTYSKNCQVVNKTIINTTKSGTGHDSVEKLKSLANKIMENNHDTYVLMETGISAFENGESTSNALLDVVTNLKNILGKYLNKE
ncbi:hypothetical protein RN001_000905 [Aquatica leii]|uniref:Uncharacterized protein n=1 Tax=Aquatica leii TaxID=1421715 RepID=A0AAN7PFJ2_9COLE|nr:hypothetical protein RN001_000905 [Aquatica leii]